MKILLFYFSGAGYTRWAVNRLSGLLIQKGHSVHMEAVENCAAADILKQEDWVDCIGFAQPIYAANMPRIMRRFIGEFLGAAMAYPALPTDVFFLNTNAYVNGYGVLEAKKLFRGSPFQIRQYVNVKMPNSAPGKRNVVRRTPVNPGEALAGNAERILKGLVLSLERGQKVIHGLGPQVFAGKLVRRILRKPILGTYKRLRVDAARCTACMKCVDTCPVHCIAVSGQDFTFSEACEACMRCVHSCPVQAISVE